jgi:hypothetical protein
MGTLTFLSAQKLNSLEWNRHEGRALVNHVTTPARLGRGIKAQAAFLVEILFS